MLSDFFKHIGVCFSLLVILASNANAEYCPVVEGASESTAQVTKVYYMSTTYSSLKDAETDLNGLQLTLGTAYSTDEYVFSVLHNSSPGGTIGYDEYDGIAHAVLEKTIATNNTYIDALQVSRHKMALVPGHP